MQIIYFTKFLAGYTPAQVGEVARKMGFDGLDLAVRAGQCVVPDKVEAQLPEAVKTWKSQGLSVPMVSLEASRTDPANPLTESVYRAAGAAGVPFIKLGYWQWFPGQDYWQLFDGLLRDLEALEKLGRKHNVCGLLHTHSDNFFFCNVNGIANALAGQKRFDPRYLGAKLDFAHLAVCGEWPPMAVHMSKPWLRAVGVKNIHHLPSGDTAGGPRWKNEWGSLEEGLVHWPTAIKLLKEDGFDGPLSVHGEYSSRDDLQEILKWVQRDVNYLKPIVRG